MGVIFSLKRMKENKETNKVILLSISFILIGLIFLVYLVLLSIGLITLQLEDYLLPAMMTIASLVLTFTVMFKSGSFLFGAKDTEILMAMPIKTESIAYSRIFAMYLFELPFVLGIMLPPFVIYCIMIQPPPCLLYTSRCV